MYIDWNNRNRFCGGCGKPTMSVNGGTKLLPPTDRTEQPPCPTRGRISNLSFPRTDTSIIAIVVSYDGKEILLGRSRRFPKGFYSCLAGFLEPAETIEDCVRREIWEESGVTVGRVVVHSTQPWPYPANIMIGCVAQVASAAPEHHSIHLGHDPELEDARWYKIETVTACLITRTTLPVSTNALQTSRSLPTAPSRGSCVQSDWLNCQRPYPWILKTDDAP